MTCPAPQLVSEWTRIQTQGHLGPRLRDAPSSRCFSGQGCRVVQKALTPEKLFYPESEMKDLKDLAQLWAEGDKKGRFIFPGDVTPKMYETQIWACQLHTCCGSYASVRVIATRGMKLTGKELELVCASCGLAATILRSRSSSATNERCDQGQVHWSLGPAFSCIKCWFGVRFLGCISPNPTVPFCYELC